MTPAAAEAMANIDGLIAAARSFYERGWMLGTSGNLSARLGPGAVAEERAGGRYHGQRRE